MGKFYPPIFGGIESVTQSLAEGAAGRGHKVDVLCFSGTRKTVVEQQAEVRIHRAGQWGVFFSQPVSLIYGFWLLRLARLADVVHLHVPNPLASLMALMVPRSVRLVVHWHSDIVKQQTLLKLFGPIQERLLRRADVIVATSPQYVEASPCLQRYQHKVRVVPIGIDPDADPADPERTRAIRQQFSGQYLVFSLGRLIYYKGFTDLIRAAALLPDDYQIVIGGKGELEAELRAQITSAGLDDRVRLVGSIPAADLPAYFSACDVFCLPSVERSEAFGVVLLEAMRYSRPIVATRIPGSGTAWVNAHGESGLNVPVGQPDELAAAIRAICESEERRNALGRGARSRLLRDFSAEGAVSAFLDLYRP